MAERSTGQNLKALHSDKGGEYTWEEFELYLKMEGICHELTVLKNSEQNSVAECMNRTLIESVHSVLADAKLPNTIWVYRGTVHCCVST